MQKKFGIAVVTSLLAAPFAVQAQGIPGGIERGAAQGNAVGGPIGGVVGGSLVASPEVSVAFWGRMSFLPFAST